MTNEEIITAMETYLIRLATCIHELDDPKFEDLIHNIKITKGNLLTIYNEKEEL